MNKGTGNANKGAGNANKGADNANKGADIANEGLKIGYLRWLPATASFSVQSFDPVSDLEPF